MSFQDPEEVTCFHRYMLAGVSDEDNALVVLLRQGENLSALLAALQPSLFNHDDGPGKRPLGGMSKIVGHGRGILESLPMESLYS